ncbi:MAG: arsenic efflux protein [Calditrichaeota bacterium]|nr:arsenic efflux protein [Calditrichota bacterium]
MPAILFDVLSDTVEISLIVFIMMIVVDFFDVQSSGKIKKLVSKTRWNQYITASFLGSTPGCLGSYANVSMYMHGFLGLGAIASGMIATSGDEAFVMLVQFPEEAILLFTVLFLVAIPLGALFDFLRRILNIKASEACHMHVIHKQDHAKNYKHYFTVHIWQHIFKKHIVRIILWTFFSLLLIEIGLNYFEIDLFVKDNIGLVLLLSALIGIIPQSGPHMVFISLFATGSIPFSVLLTSSISQDGHGLLPMLSYSLKDSVYVKIYNVVVALVLGSIAYWMGF